MSRGLALLLVLLVLIIGAVIFLSGRVKEQPTHTIEVNVATNAAAR